MNNLLSTIDSLLKLDYLKWNYAQFSLKYNRCCWHQCGCVYLNSQLFKMPVAKLEIIHKNIRETSKLQG